MINVFYLGASLRHKQHALNALKILPFIMVNVKLNIANSLIGTLLYALNAKITSIYRISNVLKIAPSAPNIQK